MFKKSDEKKIQQIEAKYFNAKKEFPGIDEISAEELKHELDSGADLVLLDVRQPEEQEVSMLPGAITKEEFEANADAYKDKSIVVYCTIGHRSGIYTAGLKDKGFNARNLKGAVLSWSHAGGEFTDTNGPTKRVHVFSPKVNLIAEGYEAVW